MKTKYKHIEFEQGQTSYERYLCCNRKDKTVLGEIEYHRDWHQFVIGFNSDCIFSSSCLNDISHFLGQLNKKEVANETNTTQT